MNKQAQEQPHSPAEEKPKASFFDSLKQNLGKLTDIVSKQLTKKPEPTKEKEEQDPEKIRIAAKLKKAGFAENEISSIFSHFSETEISNLTTFLTTLKQEKGISFGDMKMLYSITKDPEQANKIFWFMKDGFFSYDLIKQLMNLFKGNLSEFIDRTRVLNISLTPKGYSKNEIELIAVACKDEDIAELTILFRDFKRETDWDIQGILTLYDHIKNLNQAKNLLDTIRSNISDYTKETVDDIIFLKKIFDEIKHMTTDFEQFLKETIPLINFLQSKGIRDRKEILQWRIATSDIQKAKKIYDFENTYKLGIVAKISPEHWETSIEEINKHWKNNETRLAFIKHIIERNLMTGIKNDELDLFFETPEMPFCEEVYKRIHDTDKSMTLGRNLFLSGISLEQVKKLTANQLSKLEENLNKLREKYGNITIFKGRNVILLRNNQFSQHEQMDWFFPPEDISALKQSIGGPDPNLSVYESKEKNPSRKEIKKTREKILNAIETTSPPFTFVFAGHGGPDIAIYGNGAISSTDFARAIAKRRENFKDQQDALSKDIYMFGSCYSHDIIREILEKNKKLGGIQPIIMATAERGFTTIYGILDSPYRKVLKIGTKNVTIKDVLENEKHYENSNFTIYVPEENIPQQIGKTTKKNPKGKKIMA